MPPLLPAMVRCNRGVGRWFWICIGIIALVTAIAMLGSGEPPWTMALIGLGAAALFTLTRAILPRLTISPAEQSIHTRRRVVPYRAVSAIHFRRPQKAGIWVDFAGEDRRRPLARLAIDETLMAPATVEQWAALRQMIALVAGRGSASHVGTELVPDEGRIPAWRDRPVEPAQAIAALDAQIAWCQAGNRSGHRRAPMRALLGRVVVIHIHA
ncbi:hypothetical protein JL108_14840 [Aeromicrobium sp. YIM 150415]|uniref:hypothetical protein n=1 Tax=Aeromicrobium sp. YIM 150415 TaxID=2803912 RepID=UPI0019667DDD|nr:hypothetical protein [Aeromicrobium sp. YIM 150415]MBM9464732.1 hypothetical protein [Aeromicrobium sp. YIM 150415]